MFYLKQIKITLFLKSSPRLCAICIFSCCLLLSALLLNSDLQHQSLQKEELNQLHLSTIKEQLQGKLTDNANALDTFSSYIASTTDITLDKISDGLSIAKMNETNLIKMYIKMQNTPLYYISRNPSNQFKAVLAAPLDQTTWRDKGTQNAPLNSQLINGTLSLQLNILSLTQDTIGSIQADVSLPLLFNAIADKHLGLVNGFSIKAVTNNSLLADQANTVEKTGTTLAGSTKSLTIDFLGQRWVISLNTTDTVSLFSSNNFGFWIASIFLSLLFSGLVYSLHRSRIKLKQSIDTLSKQANTDMLTGLVNRQYLAKELEVIIQSHQRDGLQFALFFIDIDYFKKVNDTWGHAAGDRLLVEFASRMSNCVRKSDLLARLAGDEFVILMQKIKSPTTAEILAEKLQQQLNQPYTYNNISLEITTSIGIAIYPIDGESSEKLLSNSDLAMYTAKNNGRNSLYFFNDQMRNQAEKQISLYHEISRSLEDGHFEVQYQPIVDFSTHKVVIGEALLRWNHPEKGLLNPGDFIHVAEHTGVIRELGHWVLQAVCNDLKVMDASGIDTDISINRSNNEFHPSTVDLSWIDIIKNSHSDTNRLIFEISESLLSDKNKVHLLQVSRLKHQGIRFAIDDFFSGAAAISSLRNKAISYIKIRKHFTKTSNEEHQALIDATVQLGQSLNIGVVAVGIESEEQQMRLSQSQCHLMQGNTIAAPMPLDEFISFVQKCNQITTITNQSILAAKSIN